MTTKAVFAGETFMLKLEVETQFDLSRSNIFEGEMEKLAEKLGLTYLYLDEANDHEL